MVLYAYTPQGSDESTSAVKQFSMPPLPYVSPKPLTERNINKRPYQERSGFEKNKKKKGTNIVYTNIQRDFLFHNSKLIEEGIPYS